MAPSDFPQVESFTDAQGWQMSNNKTVVVVIGVVAAFALVCVLACGGVGIMFVRYQQAMLQAERAAREAAMARMQAQRAEAEARMNAMEAERQAVQAQQQAEQARQATERERQAAEGLRKEAEPE